MRIKEGFILRDVAGSCVVVPVGKEAADFNGMITLNETGAFLWRQLEKGCTKEELLEALQKEYDVDEERARNGVERFLTEIEENQLAED